MIFYKAKKLLVRRDCWWSRKCVKRCDLFCILTKLVILPVYIILAQRSSVHVQGRRRWRGTWWLCCMIMFARSHRTAPGKSKRSSRYRLLQLSVSCLCVPRLSPVIKKQVFMFLWSEMGVSFTVYSWAISVPATFRPSFHPECAPPVVFWYFVTVSPWACRSLLLP